MRFSDEVLMAYADGELQGDLRAEVQQAVQTDPDIAQRVAEHEALRRSMRAAFANVIDEPVPERLIAAARATSRLHTGAVHAADGRADNIVPLARERRARLSLPQWAALAASFLLGAGVWQLFGLGGGAMMAERGGQLLATGALARMLSNQLVAQQTAGSSVRIGISFRAKSGGYCRTFELPSNQTAGLACRSGERWQVQMLGRDSNIQPQSSAYRQASSALPPWLLQEVDGVIAGEALDAQAEANARAHDWH